MVQCVQSIAPLQRGVDFDFLASTQVAPRSEAQALGHDRVGREGMLALLEGQLALTAPTPLERLQACQHSLHHVLAADHILFASFQHNPVSTSRVVLTWFDALTLIGWRGEPLVVMDADARLQRFQPLSALYQQAQQSQPEPSPILSSEGLRIERCCKALKQGAVQIGTVRLLQPMSLLPKAWQQLFTTLQQHGVEVVQTRLQTIEAMDRGKLQQQVAVIRCSGKLAAARTTAQLLTLVTDQTLTQAPLLVSQRGTELDNALQHAGLPTVGFNVHQELRNLTQIIPAVVNLFSGNYSCQSLLTALNHPAWPSETSLVKQAARALSRAQGFDDGWTKAIDALIQANPEQASWFQYVENPQTYSAEQARAVLAAILTAMKAKSLRQAHVASNKEAQTDGQAMAAFARELAAVIELVTGEPDQAHSGNAIALEDLPAHIRELGIGEFGMAGNQGSVIDNVGAYGLEEPAPLAVTPSLTCWMGPYYKHTSIVPEWYATEREALSECYTLFSREQELALQQHNWAMFVTKVIKNPQQRLFIIDYDAEQLTHPLYDQLIQEGGLKAMSWETVVSSEWLQITPGNAISNSLDTTQLKRNYPQQRLYAHARRGHLANTCAVPDHMSASRFATLIFKPSDYILNYVAKIRDKQLELDTIGNRLRGNYSHKVFEAFFAAYPTPHHWQQAEAWFDAHAEAMLKQYALVFLEPGSHYEATALKQTAKKALLRLVQTFKNAGVVRVHPELSLEDTQLSMGGIAFKLRGNIDFLLEMERDGQTHYLVIDAKYSSAVMDGKDEEIKQGVAVQLYFYAAAVHKKFGQWPMVGYFIVKNGSFYIANDTVSPTQTTTSTVPGAIEVATPETIPQLWQAYTALAVWRLQQFEQGMLDIHDLQVELVPGLSTPEDDRLAKLLAAYRKIHFGTHIGTRDMYSDYKYLTGWCQVESSQNGNDINANQGGL